MATISPFPERIANERSHEPLQHDQTSGLIRRRLLHGERLSESQVHAEYGKSKGLIGTVVGLMAEWGFVVGTDIVNGERVYFIRNPEHEPVVRTPKERVGPPRARRPRRHAEPVVDESGVTPGKRLRQRLLSGEPTTASDAVDLGVDASYLRKLVRVLQEKGHEFVRTINPVTYTLKTGARTPAIARRTTKPVPMNGSSYDAPIFQMPFPEFESKLEVAGLVRTGPSDDRRYVVVLENEDGTRKWQAELTGFHEIS